MLGSLNTGNVYYIGFVRAIGGVRRIVIQCCNLAIDKEEGRRKKKKEEEGGRRKKTEARTKKDTTKER